MIKAQSMLPVYEHTADLRTQRATAVTALRVQQQQAQMQIAQLMAAMRIQHLSSLGNMYITGRGQNINQSLEQQRIDLASSTAARSGMNVGGGGGAGAGGSLFPNYIGNSGPVTSRGPNQIGSYISNAGGADKNTEQNTVPVGYGGPGTRMGGAFGGGMFDYIRGSVPAGYFT
jgi:hypothetical protein